MPSRASAILVVTALALAATGCGLKGPLYDPDAKKEQVGTSAETEANPSKRRTPVVPPAPQSQKKEGVSPPDPDRPATVDPVAPPGL